MLSLPFLESTGSIFPRRVYKNGVGLEFIEKISILKFDTLVAIFGIYGVDWVHKSGVDFYFIEK